MKYLKYPSYKDSGDEWIGEIPEHWDVMRARWLFREINERSTNGDELLLSVSEYYGIKPRKDVIDPGDFLTNAVSLEGYKKCRKNDLIINIMLAWKSALGITDYDGIVSPSYNVFRPLDIRGVKYFHYLLRTKVYADIFRINSTGIIDSRLRLYPDSFASVKVIYPPMDEQDLIGKFLDVELRRIDSLALKQQKMIELLKEKRQALITQSVTKGLDPDVQMKDSGVEWIGEIPEHWKANRLKMISSLVTEKVQSKDNQVGLENIEGWTGKFLPSETEFEGDGIGFHAGDILFGKLRPYLAKVFEAKSEGEAVGDFIVIRHFECIQSSYLSYYLLNRDFINATDNASFGAKMPRVNWEFVGNVIVATPPIDEQLKIVEHLNLATQNIDDLIEKHQQMIELLNEHRSSLITQAVTGKIDIREHAKEVSGNAGQTP